MGKEIDYESKEIKKWVIFQGLNGGFGGANFETFETCTAKEAMDIAYQAACDTYENHAGNHGIRSTNDIMEEDNVDEEEADEIYNEERENWIDYHIEEYDPIQHSEYENKLGL